MLSSLIQFVKKQKIIIAIFLFFLVVYSFLSLYRHYNFISGFWDISFFNHGLWQYSHFKMARNAFNSDLLMLADHFSPVIMLYAPFYYLFGSYTFLVIQIFFVLLGGVGILRYVRVLYPDLQKWAALFLVYFFSGWGIWTAVQFDFHNNVVSAMCIPWLLLFYHTREKKKFLGVYLFMILCQEHIAFQITFILIALIVQGGWRIHEKMKKYPPPDKKSILLLSPLLALLPIL